MERERLQEEEPVVALSHHSVLCQQLRNVWLCNNACDKVDYFLIVLYVKFGLLLSHVGCFLAHV